MSFINKKNIVSGYSVSKKTFQFYIGVKHIIIVADDPIHPGAEIQAHLKRAHLPLFCLFQDLFAAEGLFGSPQFINRIIHSVKMTFCPGTFLRRTLGFFAKTQLFLCSDGHRLKKKAFCPQNLKGILSNGSGNSFCRKIKEQLPFSLSNCPHRRKYRGHGFSHSCRRLYKNLFFAGNSMINAGNHFSLAFAVRKGEFQIFHGGVSFFLPSQPEGYPFMIFSCKFLIPGFQLFSGKRFPEPSDFFCIQMGIRHLNVYFFQIVLKHIDPGITHGLSPVNLHRTFQMLQFFVNAFDLINTHGFFFCKNTVRSSLYPKDQILIFCVLLQRNLRPVAASHLLLNFAVDTAALLHCLLILYAASAVQISASQNKFHKITDRNADYFLFHYFSTSPKISH